MSGIKQTAKQLGSGIMEWCFRSRLICRAFDWMAYERWRVRRREVEGRLRARGLYGDEVFFGPFKGMRYSPAWASNRFEKVLGAYEAELHPVLEDICRRPYTEVINVGCAEGYYAVGLARRLSAAIVYAYDIKPEMLRNLAENARLNGVGDRVVPGGFCTPETMGQLPLRGRTLVVSDCEGYEMELLDPVRAPMLRRADVLVELHDFKNRAISRTILERFAPTHDIQVLQNEGLRYANYPVLRQLNFAEIQALTGEERLEIMDWFFMEARA
jgi:hypothetical protein